MKIAKVFIKYKIHLITSTILLMSALIYAFLTIQFVDMEKIDLNDPQGTFEIRCFDNKYWLIYKPSPGTKLPSYYGDDSKLAGNMVVKANTNLEPFCNSVVDIDAKFSTIFRTPLCREDGSGLCETGKVPGVIIRDIKKIRDLTKTESLI